MGKFLPGDIVRDRRIDSTPSLAITTAIWSGTAFVRGSIVAFMKSSDVALVLGDPTSSANNANLVPVLMNGFIGYVFESQLVKVD